MNLSRDDPPGMGGLAVDRPREIFGFRLLSCRHSPFLVTEREPSPLRQPLRLYVGRRDEMVAGSQQTTECRSGQGNAPKASKEEKKTKVPDKMRNVSPGGGPQATTRDHLRTACRGSSTATTGPGRTTQTDDWTVSPWEPWIVEGSGGEVTPGST